MHCGESAVILKHLPTNEKFAMYKNLNDLKIITFFKDNLPKMDGHYSNVKHAVSLPLGYVARTQYTQYLDVLTVQSHISHPAKTSAIKKKQKLWRPVHPTN